MNSPKFLFLALFDHKSVNQSARKILWVRKGSKKHDEPFSYFSGNNIVCLLRHMIHHKEKMIEKLIDAHAFVPFSRKVDSLHIAYLNSHLHSHIKYLIRKWRMAHFVGSHRWVFFNFRKENNAKSIHR